MPFKPRPRSCIGERYSLARRRVKQIVRLASSLDSEPELSPDVISTGCGPKPTVERVVGAQSADLVPVR